MARIAAAPQRRTNLALWALVLLGVGLLSLLPLTLIENDAGTATTASTALLTSTTTRIAYFGFDRTDDTLWLADPANPEARVKGLTIAHAPDYGIIPTLSPDRRSVAYLVLPPNTAAPGPDAPADLWVTSIEGGEPKLLASGADLLVHAVWTPDQQGLVYRSSGDSFQLLRAPLDGSPPTELVSSANALFPVAFAGNDLYYVELDDSGSRLKSTSGAISIKLSNGLTRDWALSPDGKQLAYLEMTLSGQQATSRAFVLDLATGERTQVGATDNDAFSPAWSADGSLVIGQLGSGASSPAALIEHGTTATLTPPRRGFDVPLAADPGAGLAVTSFDGNSIINPGRASLVVVGPDGTRREIASGEVTFLGWITP
jgi:hypothetical protein